MNQPSLVTENLDEARYNLATRVMSNGVEVIIAGDKGRPSENGNDFDQRISPSQIKKPMTLAPSTLKNQMILLMPSNIADNITIPVSSNQFVTKTCLTTYTYRTTYLQDGKTTIESREKVVSNIATEDKNNYLKIKPTPSMGVTLTRTPQLAVGVFPTTYSYYYTLYDGEAPLVVTSQHTILNTITAPDDDILFLQPSETAVPVIDTNTYYNRVYISRTINDADVQKIITKPETLTQVVITESLPARSTLVLTSYYALDIDETRTERPELATKSEYDLHIYATKTFRTTVTYLTPALLNSTQLSNKNAALNENYHTRVIENVVTESIPSSLLKPELLTKFRYELKRGKNQRRVIITTATLLGGQTMEITAMKLIGPSIHSNSKEDLHSSIKPSSNTQSDKLTTSLSPKIVPSKTKEAIEATKLVEDSNMAGSEQAAVYVAAPTRPTTLKPEKVKDHKIKTKLKTPYETNNPTSPQPTMSNIFNSINLNSLTALRPVINAVAGLIQSKFTGNDVQPVKNTSLMFSPDSPMYIPVNDSPLNQNQVGLASQQEQLVELAPPQSLHIEPPQADFTLTDDNWLQADSKIAPEIQERHKTHPNTYKTQSNINQGISLVNGGIPIRPGEVITANSDVIVGKPNGIEQPQIYTLQSQQQHSQQQYSQQQHSQHQHSQQQQSHLQSNIIPLRLGGGKQTSLPTSVSYYQHVIQHPLHHKKQQLPYTEKTNKQKTNNELKQFENYDDILKPPPMTSQSIRFPGSNYKTLHDVKGPHNVAFGTSHQNWLQKPQWSLDNGQVGPLQAPQVPEKNIFNLNNELKDNEIIEIKRVPQIYSTDIPPTTVQFQTANDATNHRNVLHFNYGVTDFSNQSYQNFYKYQNKLGEPVSSKNINRDEYMNTPQTTTKPNSVYNKKQGLDHQQLINHYASDGRRETARPIPNPSHQQINFKDYVLSHNVAINAPPLTFRKEIEYPVATSVHGVPSKVGKINMPHVKIPPNEKEVQVSLTPQHSVSHLLNVMQNSVRADVQTQTIGSFAVSDDVRKVSNKIRNQQQDSYNKHRLNNNRKALLQANIQNTEHVQHIPLEVLNYTGKDDSQTLSSNAKNSPNISFGNSWTSLVNEDNDIPAITTKEQVDQTAAPSLSKSSLQFSHKFKHTKDQNDDGLENSTKNSKSKLPLLTPFAALQVNNMDETYKERDRNSHYTKKTNEHISSPTQNYETSKTKTRPNTRYPTVMPSRSPTSPNTKKHSVHPKLPFSSGSPFSTLRNVKPTSQSNGILEPTKKVFISTGEVFKVADATKASPYGTMKPIKNSHASEHEILVSQETNNVATKESETAGSIESQFNSRTPNITLTTNSLTQSSSVFPSKYPHQSTSEVLGMSPPPLQPSYNPVRNSMLTTKVHYHNTPRKPSRNMLPPPTTLVPLIEDTHTLLNENRPVHGYTPFVHKKQTSSVLNAPLPSGSMPRKKLTANISPSASISIPFAISTTIQFSKSFRQPAQSVTKSIIEYNDSNNLASLPNSQATDVTILNSNVWKPHKSNSHFDTIQDHSTLHPIILEPSIESIISSFSTEDFKTPTTTIEKPNFSQSHDPIMTTGNENRQKPSYGTQPTRIVLPTKYITNTVTTTKTTVLTTTAYSQQYLENSNKDTKNLLSTTTFLLTKTLTSTILDTITEIHTLVQPTRVTESHTVISTETTTETKTKTRTRIDSATILKATPVDFNYKSYNPGIGYGSVVDYNINENESVHRFELKTDFENLVNKNSSHQPKHPITENVKVASTDNNNIFIVLTNKQPGNAAIPVNSTLPDTNGNTLGEIELDYDDSINFDIPARDEQLFTDTDSKGKVNNVLLGGVLIATPERESIQSNFNDNSSSSQSIKCYPTCKSTRNEVCKPLQSGSRCVCRAGFARMFPDRPCKPTYTYTMKIQVHRMGKYQLNYDSHLADNTTKDFRHLAAVTHDAIDRMVMQSDFRDIYHGVHLVSFDETKETNGDQEVGVTAHLLLQLSDISEERRLEGVFKKYLRLSNFSIGGTELFTSRKGSEALAINDFDECSSSNFNDCSENSRCFNLEGTYTCSCFEGFVDSSENPVYPGRICSAELVGCEQCHYHGQCVVTQNLASTSSDSESTVCDCFAWYSGSTCQLNLKILLIALIGVGTLLFIVLLICLLLTCTNNRREPIRPRTTAFLGIQPIKQRDASLISVKISPKRNRKMTSGLLKTNKTNDKHDKHAMIKDTSSESSQSSLPYVLKESGHSGKRQKISHVKNDVHFPKSIEHTFLQNQIVDENKSRSKTVLLPTFAPYQHAILTEIEQSDRSLTVMIPRAKYHHSVLPQTKLLHHQLTMERTAKTEKEFDIPNPPQSTNIERHHNKSGGALVSAGFEVSAIVSKSVLNPDASFEDPTAAENNSNSNTSNFNAITIEDSEKTTSRENASESHNSDCNLYKADENFIDTMDEWLDNMQQKQLSAEARSFDETTIRATTKLMKRNCDNQTLITNEEANTMAERDIGSTFLLPHTHLYKPERESEISGLESF